MMTVPTLAEIVRGCVAQVGTQRALADMLAISRPRIGRAIDGVEKLSVETCLKLARICDHAPGEILRAAGRAEIADLIEEHYGKQHLSVHDRQHLAQWHTLPVRLRAKLTELLDLLVRGRSAGHNTKTGAA